MKVKLAVYGFKSFAGPIGMQTVLYTIEGEVSQEELQEIKKHIHEKESR